LFGVAAWLLAFAGQSAVQRGLHRDAALLFGAGVIVFVVVFWAKRFDPMRTPEIDLPQETGLLRQCIRDPWAVRVGFGLLALALLLTVNALQLFYEFEPFAAQAWLWHGASLLAALLAAPLLDAGLADRSKGDLLQSETGGAPRSFLRYLTEHGGLLLTVAGVSALALLLRLYRFDDLPFGVWYDEAEHGLQALRIVADERFRPIFEGAINGPAHYLYLVALSFEWFGVSVQSIRLVSVLFGVLAVGAGYIVGAELFGRRVGLVLAALLAVSSWGLTLSRFGMYATMSTPLFALLTAAFVLRSLRTERLLDFTLAGLWLGLGLCFYTSFRLFAPVAFVFLGYHVIYTLATRRTLPSLRFWLGLGMLLFMAALVVSPLAVYAAKHPEVFWARIENTFIFAGKSEAERWPALWENLRKHFLMFNVFGDPNGRHNLPGNPMLDPVTGSLFVVGAAYALRRALQPRYLFLLAWLAAALMGGALSLDFEAPQSLRANGTLPAAYVIAVIPLAVLTRAWRLSAGVYYPDALRLPAVALVAAIAALNVNTYFVRQANDFAVWNAFSTPETLTARLLADLDPETDAYVTAFFRGHPTLRFVARNARPYAELNTLDQFPLNFPPGRSALLVLNADSRGLYDEARRLYPNARFEELAPPVNGPPVVFTVHLSPDDIASIRGLIARYYSDAAWGGEPALVRSEAQIAAEWSQDSPLAEPFSVEWEGFLHVRTAGQHEFFWEAPAAAEASIGEQVVLSGNGALSGALSLAQGVHPLRVRAVGAAGRVQLAWRIPDGLVEVIPPTAYYNAPRLGHGLLGRYFGNGEWNPPEVMSRIDARFDRYVHVTPLPRPYTVEWTGKVAAPVDGVYRFGLESIDESMLWIDETLVVEAKLPNTYTEGEIELTQGLHDIRIRHADRTNHTHINVFWQLPGGPRQIIPVGALYPPQQSYERVTLPTLDALTAGRMAGGAGAPPAPLADEPTLPGSARTVVSGLVAPRGVAVSGDGSMIYVAESGAARVTIFDADGNRLGVIDGDGEVLREATDVAVSADRVFVLDAGAGRVRAFTLDGAPLDFATSLDPIFADRSRGIGLAPDGRVLIANTPNNRIAVLDAAGAVAAQVIVWPGEDAQPVDAVVGAGGRLFVTEAHGHRLIRYTPEGQRERAWPMAVANTVDSPHLVVGADGALYITEPESGRILLRDAQGEPAGAWNLSAMLGRPVRPVGIAVSADGVIWLVDSGGGTLIALEGLR
jgi:DNA-binding beta-propeller fold protein YncE